MKSADLIIGTEYYANGSNNWLGEGWSGRGRKVTVLDNALYHKDSIGGWGSRGMTDSPVHKDITLSNGETLLVPQNIRLGRGSYHSWGVLVMQNAQQWVDDGRGYETVTEITVCQPQHIRGTYEDCTTRIDEIKAVWESTRKAQEDARARWVERYTDLKTRFGAYGVPVQSGDRHEIGFSPDTAERLLLMLEAQCDTVRTDESN